MNTHKVVNDNIGNKYFVFSNYDHFTKPGFAAGADDDIPIYGEIHGGAAPEEMLVPVLTVDSRYESPLTAKWSAPGNTVKISNKRARCRIQFSKMVSSVQAKMDGIDAECSSITIPSKEWTITFSGLKLNKEKEFNVSVLADGILVNIDSIKIRKVGRGKLNIMSNTWKPQFMVCDYFEPYKRLKNNYEMSTWEIVIIYIFINI